MVSHTVQLGALLHVSEIFVHSSLLLRCGELLHEFALRCQYHEGNAEDGVGTCGEDGEVEVLICHLELHLSSFRTTDPVALCLLDGITPVYCLQSVKQTL